MYTINKVTVNNQQEVPANVVEEIVKNLEAALHRTGARLDNVHIAFSNWGEPVMEDTHGILTIGDKDAENCKNNDLGFGMEMAWLEYNENFEITLVEANTEPTMIALKDAFVDMINKMELNDITTWMC